jgi:pyridoxal phosphate enzyme (YggS family)
VSPAVAEAVAARLAAVRGRIERACARASRDPAGVTLIGVTKSVPDEAVRAALACGLRDLGENYVQEGIARKQALAGATAGVRWHLIGHLQSNKAKAAAGAFDIIHAVDSDGIARALDARASGRVPVLLEVNAGEEASKFGFSPREVGAAVREVSNLPHLDLRGLMTVAPAADDPEDVRNVFRALRELAAANGLSELSMGMTGDFEVAIEEGATMIRIGRAIFGERRR